MKKHNVLTLFSTILCGALLNLLGLVCSELPYFGISSQAFTWILSFSMLAGVIITTIPIIKRRTMIGSAVWHSFFTFVCWGFFTVVTGYTKIIQNFHAALKIPANSMADNVSGMLLLTFAVAMIITCVFSIALCFLSSVFSPKHQKTTD